MEKIPRLKGAVIKNVIRISDSMFNFVPFMSRTVQAAVTLGRALFPKMVVNAGTRLNTDKAYPL